jgi:glucokinase
MADQGKFQGSVTAMTGYVLGVDVGGTSVKISGMKRDCVPLRVERSPTITTSQAAIIESIYKAIEKYLDREAERPAAAGMGLVGHINSKDGIWENAINIRITEPVNIRADILKKFNLPVFINNDVRMATYAEMTLGAGREAEDFIYINIGTGIAAGIVSNGRIISGVCNYAGEIGHMVYGDPARICKCGRKGCLEPCVSGGGLVNIAREKATADSGCSFTKTAGAENFNAGLIFREAEKGDSVAADIAETAFHAQESLVTDLVNLLNPALIVFGGGAIEKEFILNRLTEYVYKNALPVAARGLKGIRISEIDPALVGLIGAGCAAWKGLEGL